MKTVIKECKTYKFDELGEKGKENAINNLSDINVDYGWWQSTYEDAENIGIKITSFDLDRSRHAGGKFIEDAEYTAHRIVDYHGPDCETHKTAKLYLEDRDKAIESAEKDENGEFVDVYELDNTLDGLEDEFLKSILEDYSIILQHEYEYLCSKESIIETIEANDYDFLENGKLF